MADTYTEQRRQQLLELLDPQLSDSEQVDSLSQFLEAEVDAAFKRGLRYAERRPARGGAGEDRSRFTSSGRRLPYSSAVQGGKLRRADRAHAAE